MASLYGRRAGTLQPVNAFLTRAMPPRYDLRMELNRASGEWPEIVGSLLGKQSALLDLSADGELLLVAGTPLVASRLSMMGENIICALAEKYRLEVRKVRVVVGRIPLRPAPASDASASRKAAVQIQEGDVRELERSYRERSPDLPEDAALSLARLQIFFTKRFGGKK